MVIYILTKVEGKLHTEDRHTEEVAVGRRRPHAQEHQGSHWKKLEEARNKRPPP